MIRPMSFAFHCEGEDQRLVREVFMVGNPLIIWFGLLAILVVFWDWLRTRRRDAFAILTMYLALYLTWGITPRGMGFFLLLFSVSDDLGSRPRLYV